LLSGLSKFLEKSGLILKILKGLAALKNAPENFMIHSISEERRYPQ
jgi:hypothetical protein